jgi:hypothetical protein
VDDTFIYENDPTGNYGSDCCPGAIDRYLVRFNLPAEMNGKQILSATLAFFVWNQNNYHDNEFLKIYTITKPWEESSATWLNAADKDPWAVPGGDADMSTLVGQIPHMPDPSDWDHAFYPSVDISPLVQQWTDGVTPNNGLMVVNDCQTEIGFKSSKYSDGSRPYLEIVYTDKSIPNHVETNDPDSYQLCANYPNPFNGGTIIQFHVPVKTNVEIKVFNLQGREIDTLVSGLMEPGMHQVPFSAHNLASAVYLYSVRIGQVHMVRKMLLVR